MPEFSRQAIKRVLLATTCGLMIASAAHAADAATRRFDIQPQPLGSALTQFAQQSQMEIAFRAEVTRGKRVGALRGALVPQQALNELLAGSGLTYRTTSSGAILIAENRQAAETPSRPPVLAPNEGARRRTDTVSAPEAGSAASAAATDPADALGEIIVTAQKRSQSINDVGLTIAALGVETLEKQGIRSLDDLARSVPGLSYAGTDFGTPVFTLRGVGFYDNSLAASPTTSVYVDEVPLPFPVMTANTNLDLERIEVLKGPQGTLFGQNSTGGAINFIAAKPTTDLSAGMNVTVGRFGQGEANAYVSGPVTDTLGVRLAGQYGYGDPWQRSFTRDDSLGKRNLLNGRLLVDWAPTPDLKIKLNLNGWRDRSDPQAGQYFATFPQVVVPDGSSIDPVLRTYPFAPSDPRAADWNPSFRPKGDKWQYQAALRADLNLSDDIVLTSLTSYVRFHTRQTLDRDSITVKDQEFVDIGSVKSLTQELRVAGGEGTSFRWVFGGNYEHSKVFEKTLNDYSESTVANVLDVRKGIVTAANNFRNYALFGNAEYDITPELTFKAGARYTNARRRADLCTFDAGDGKSNAFAVMFARLLNPGLVIPDLQPGDCTTLNSQFLPARFLNTLKEHNFSWRVGFDYKPSRDVLFYVNVSKGYKAGGYPTTAGFVDTGLLPVTQESLLDYEGGFKAKLLGRSLGLNGAVFYYDYRNKQLLTKVIDPVVGLVPALANIPKSEVKGAELELTAAPVDGLHLNAVVTYLDAQITKYSGVNAGGVQADFAGTKIPFTPKWQYSANVDYELPATGPVRPFVGATLTKRAGTSSIVGGATGAVIVPGYRSLVPIGDTYDIPGYALLDLRAGVEADDGRWRLMIWGKNVANKYYWQNVVTVYDVVTRFAGMPATYGVTFSYKFDR
jgi:outer membrane receptor protein involved in Fe transport